MISDSGRPCIEIPLGERQLVYNFEYSLLNVPSIERSIIQTSELNEREEAAPFFLSLFSDACLSSSRATREKNKERQRDEERKEKEVKEKKKERKKERTS